jgi:hypothetical protein
MVYSKSNWMLKIKNLKRDILGDYYNMFNCKKTSEEIRELYDYYELKYNLGITLSELYYITHCKFTEEEYCNIKIIKSCSRNTKVYMWHRHQSLPYPYTNVARLYYLPTYPIFTLINDLQKLIPNAINIEIIHSKGHNFNHAAITFKTYEKTMAFVLNNETIKYGNRFCIVAFGFPEKETKGEEKLIEEGYNTAVSCYNFLDM